MCRCRSDIPKVDGLKRAVWITHEHEASASDAAVMWGNNADAEDRADESICRIAARLEQVCPYLAAYLALGRNTPESSSIAA